MDFCKRGGVSYATVMGVVTLLGCCAQPTHSERSRAILSHRNLGLAHLEENHLEAARAEFTQLIEALPGDPLGYANLSLTYLRDDDPERALVLIEKALTLDPQNPALRLILAEIHQAQRNDDQA
ncbi:MAG: tetratricopeptide repeat protein, partial [Planctomycetes bacterium]|nr:tetratricopeptide repeat protein [Planctomycetota bacterium]